MDTSGITICPEMEKVLPLGEMMRLLDGQPNGTPIRVDGGRFPLIEDAMRVFAEHLEAGCDVCKIGGEIERFFVPAIYR